MGSLNETEAYVYNYVVKNTKKVLKESIRELANDTHVSTATIMRFCKKMGCEGFTELKYRLKESEEMQETKEDNVTDQFGHHFILWKATKKLLFEEIYRYKNKNIVIPDLYLKQMQSLKNKDILTIQSISGYKTQYELEVIGEVDTLSSDTLYMYCKSGSQYYCINLIMV